MATSDSRVEVVLEGSGGTNEARGGQDSIRVDDADRNIRVRDSEQEDFAKSNSGENRGYRSSVRAKYRELSSKLRRHILLPHRHLQPVVNTGTKKYASSYEEQSTPEDDSPGAPMNPSLDQLIEQSGSNTGPHTCKYCSKIILNLCRENAGVSLEFQACYRTYFGFNGGDATIAASNGCVQFSLLAKVSHYTGYEPGEFLRENKKRPIEATVGMKRGMPSLIFRMEGTSHDFIALGKFGI
ncbi:hypothetical protein B0H67DRAFT_389795 [Lasiosphaeris hirsuta]|uniref:Uncharacterized protein n=1 Tax=Lasiosphaeris hirsuta TaxID=260670 RepID=A0AA40DMX1_9PEZI|nr:hypothetical protein B0H67DRAFT_389795 [Lasiosphaeris hirsuta]